MMDFLESYSSSLNNTDDLSSFIKQRGSELFDYYGLINFSALELRRRDFEKFSVHWRIVGGLDFSLPGNEAYLNLLLLTSIRLGDRFVFERLYKILKEKELPESSIIQASSLFMWNIRERSELLNNLPKILDLLEFSCTNESDSDEDAISCLVNFYSLFANDFYEFSLPEVKKLRDQILLACKQSDYSFLKNDFLISVLQLEFKKGDNPYYSIQKKLDNFLGRTRTLAYYQRGYLIERDTEYAAQIMEAECSLKNILKTNSILYSQVQDDQYFYSLGRGINVLDKEEQLLAYMYAYGKMHIAKLERACSYLPEDVGRVEVIDWGCGQGLATMALLDRLNSENINSVTLIEPSILCLKRAALHVNQQFSKLATINKDFDSLSFKDLEIIPQSGQYVHLFSNILDVELYSIKALISLVKQKFKGTNYFVISSPYISTLKTARIDSFIDAFNEDFEVQVYYSSNKRSGEWIKSWSKVIRVVKVEIFN